MKNRLKFGPFFVGEMKSKGADLFVFAFVLNQQLHILIYYLFVYTSDDSSVASVA